MRIFVTYAPAERAHTAQECRISKQFILVIFLMKKDGGKSGVPFVTTNQTRWLRRPCLPLYKLQGFSRGSEEDDFFPNFKDH